MSHGSKGILGKVTEYSLPLIAGVFVALAAANLAPEWYHRVVEGAWGFAVLGHEVNLHWFINDIFMVFFFAVAAKEIVDAVLPGGALSPVSKAINPLLGTLGGVLGPVGVYFLLTYLLYDDPETAKAVANGWAVPTATDIALAWLAARLVFGPNHAAVSFLLLLAIADDAIGLGIIAVFYPDPEHPVHVSSLWFAGAGMVVSMVLRRMQVMSWWPYIVFGGGLAWYGLIQAHLHPALALVPIVPFLPKITRTGLIGDPSPTFAGEQTGEIGAPDPTAHGAPVSPLDDFEHAVKPYVDWGLSLFAFSNAGVLFANIGPATWIVLASLVVGKTAGITLFSGVGAMVGFPLPSGMGFKHLITAGLVAGLGLTVALFVCGVAFTDVGLQGEAKMGALFSGGVFVVSLVVARMLGIKPEKS